MNVAKNWVLTIKLIALAFAHFSSELLWKEQIIIPVKKKKRQKTLVISTQNWSILAKFAQKKNQAKWAVFYWLFLGEVSPRKFPWNRPIFLRILTFLRWKPCEIGRFCREFWLFSREIGRFFREFANENPTKFCFFSAKYQKPWL